MKRVDSKYTLVVAAAKRARQLDRRETMVRMNRINQQLHMK